jgi:thymidylate synthase
MLEKDILIVNSKSNISIATLWAKKDFIFNSLPENVKNKINIIGTLYTINGIKYLIQTLGENPQINKIILYGPDLTLSGQALIDIFNNKDKETLKRYNINLDYDKIREILNTTNVIDMRKDFWNKNMSKLEEIIESNYKPENIFRRKIDIEIKENVKTDYGYTRPLPAESIYDESLFNAWVKILTEIKMYGILKDSEYKEKQLERLNLSVSLELYGRTYQLEKEFDEFIKLEEFEKHLKGYFIDKKPEGVDYTYGERFLNYNNLNQLEYIISKLSENPETRRAIMITWNPNIDTHSKDPPCVISIEGIIQNGYLNLTEFIRSNDMFRGWPLNMYALIRIGEYIVNEINKRTNEKYELGVVTTFSASAHVYEHDFPYMEKVLEKYGYRIKSFVPDPKGNFIIYNEDNKTFVEHRSYDNTILDFKFGSENVDEIYNKLKGLPFFTSYDHAIYVGREIERAYEFRITGKKYIQDQV